MGCGHSCDCRLIDWVEFFVALVRYTLIWDAHDDVKDMGWAVHYSSSWSLRQEVTSDMKFTAHMIAEMCTKQTVEICVIGVVSHENDVWESLPAVIMIHKQSLKASHCCFHQLSVNKGWGSHLFKQVWLYTKYERRAKCNQTAWKYEKVWHNVVWAKSKAVRLMR